MMLLEWGGRGAHASLLVLGKDATRKLRRPMAFYLPNNLRCLRSRLFSVKSIRAIKRHCPISECLLHLISFNNSCARMLFGICNRYILPILGIPCMLNILNFAHNTNN